MSEIEISEAATEAALTWLRSFFTIDEALIDQCHKDSLAQAFIAHAAAATAAGEAEIEAAWRLIESEFDIEPRAQIEAEAKTNGFKYGLAQAIHTIWKRDPKVADLASAAEAMLKIVHEAIDDLGAKSHCHDVQAKLAFHSQALAAALEKRGRV